MVEHRPPRNWTETLPAVLVVALLVIGGLAGYAVSERNEERQIREVVTEFYEGTREDVQELCDDKANATKPECAVTPPPAEQLAPEVDSPPGPTNAQVRVAVNDLLPVFIGPGFADYCGENRCQGKRGKKGKDAPPVTLDQVLEAVTTFCAPRNDCTPAAPADGQDAPRITDIDCDGTTGVFTFDRGDPIRVDNMCPAPPPEPEPTPEP